MIFEHDKKWLGTLVKKVDKLIEHECDGDRSYYNFHFSVDFLGAGFIKLDDMVLIDDGKEFCGFCHALSHFYYDKLQIHLCAKCYAEIESGKKGT